MNFFLWISIFCVLFATTATSAFPRSRRQLLVPRNAGTTSSGMEVVASQKLLNYGAIVVNSLIAAELSKTTIPKISGEKDGFNYKVENCKLSATIESPAASFVAGSGLSIALDDINLHANCDWSYQLHDWPHLPDGSGSLDASAGGSTSASAIVDVAIVDGKVHLDVTKIGVNIDNFDVSIHGSMFSWLYDLIVDAFKGDIKNDISNAAQGAVKNIIETTLNEELASMDLTLDISFPSPFNIAEVDFTITEIDVNKDAAIVATRSSVNDTRHPTTNPYPIPAPPIKIAATTEDENMVTIGISAWPINNGFWTFSQAGLLQYPLKPSDIPSSFPIQLNTTDFNEIAPGLFKVYPNCAINILLDVPIGFTEVARILPNEGVAVKNLPLNLNFSVLPNTTASALPAFALQCLANASANASVTVGATKEQEVIHLLVETLACSTLRVISSSFGNISTAGLDMLISTVLTNIVLPDINRFLGSGFALPSFDGVCLTNTSIIAVNGSLQISSDIEWNPAIKSLR